MNFKNNLELSIYLRSFGIFDTNIISAIEEIPIEFFKTENINKNISLKQKFKNKFDKQFNDGYLAAVIAQKLQLKSNEKILEIGTGSGYLTAIFSRLSRKVYTIEKLKTLYVLANNNFKEIQISGHADNVGSDEYNYSLSEARAEAVVNYILSIDPTIKNIYYKGYGNTVPIRLNYDGPENRRIEFKINN